MIGKVNQEGAFKFTIPVLILAKVYGNAPNLFFIVVPPQLERREVVFLSLPSGPKIRYGCDESCIFENGCIQFPTTRTSGEGAWNGNMQEDRRMIGKGAGLNVTGANTVNPWVRTANIIYP